jgi:hypothetical protein
MLGLQYSRMALDHWNQWRPKAVAEMRKAGTLDREVQAASKEAARQVAALMAAGAQIHEAEEMVLPQVILLPPEPDESDPETDPAVSDARMGEIDTGPKAKLGDQLNAGIDPEIIALGAELALGYLERGTRRFAAWSAQVVADLGEEVRPFLRAWYESARYYPGFDATGMDRPEVVRAELAKIGATPPDGGVNAAAIEAPRQRSSAGIDPSVLAAGIELGLICIEEGAVKFRAWARLVLADAVEMSLDPEAVKLTLKPIYLAISAEVADDVADQMDDRATVRAFDLDMLDQGNERAGLTREQVVRLRMEERRRRNSPDLIHNLEMHRRILRSWELERPAMWARLSKQNLTETLAFLAQQRMQEERDRLLEAGMPITDAREQAERAHLMLGPEPEVDSNPEAEPGQED